jgi:uncharacterized protein YukE
VEGSSSFDSAERPQRSRAKRRWSDPGMRPHLARLPQGKDQTPSNKRKMRNMLLNKGDADKLLKDVGEARDQVLAKLSQIEHEQEGLTSTWQGAASLSYQKAAGQLHGDFKTVLDDLDHVITTAKLHLDQKFGHDQQAHG